ncbi:hypothetical protein ACP275_14G016000 [Erythranthe tilingii]
MATGKAPWSQQYQEVAALFYVGTTKSHPPIPEHLSREANDFLLKCLQKEPDLTSTASELLKHPFVTGDSLESHLILRHSLVREGSGKRMADFGMEIDKSVNLEAKRSCNGLKDVSDRYSTVHPDQSLERGSLWKPSNFDDEMCCIDNDDDLALGASAKFTYNQSYNPMCEPNDDCACKFDENTKLCKRETGLPPNQTMDIGNGFNASGEVDFGFTFPREQPGAEDDDEVTEFKIRAFLDEKAFELKKLQTPLYNFYNSSNVAGPPSPTDIPNKENVANFCNLPPKSRSPNTNRVGSKRLSTAMDSSSPGSCPRRPSNMSDVNFLASQDVKDLLPDSQQDPLTESCRFNEIQRKWKEELDEELERTRELMRQAGASKTSSPKDRISNRHKDRLRFASPGK